MSTCPYCERPSVVDSRGRCRECGAAQEKTTPPVFETTLPAAFVDFVAATAAMRHRCGIIYPEQKP